MPAPKGNQFWKARSKHGRDKLIASTDLLIEACEEYFNWVEDNPLVESKLTSFQGVNKIAEVPKMRAMTIDGLCIFLNIDYETWRSWKNDKDYLVVINWAEKIIKQQKFTGAAADLLNPNIIARDLGLRDAQESTNINLNKEIDTDVDLDKEILDRYFEKKGKE